MTILITIATLLLCASNPSPNLLETIELTNQNPASQKETYDSSNSEQQSPRSSAVGQSAGSANEHSPTHEPKYTDPYDPRDDALYRLYLVATIVGSVGALVGIGVLCVQSILIKRSTKATERSVKLQEDTSRQWVDLKSWYVVRIDATQPLDVGFNIVNPTKLPLTFHGIIGTANGAPFDETAPNMLITPNDPMPYSFGVTLDQEQETLRTQGAVSIDVECSVFFKDSHNIHWRQDITGKLAFGSNINHPFYTVTRHDLTESGVPGERGSRDVELPK